MKKLDQKQTTEETASVHNPSADASRRALGARAFGAAAALLSVVATACGDDDDAAEPANGGSPGQGGAANSGGKTSTAKGGATAQGGTEHAGAGGAGPASDADIDPLNALLAAEYNAITAYTAGAGLIGDAPSSDPLYDLAETITAIAVSIQAQHKLHAAALVSAIEDLGGKPVEEAAIADAFVPPKALLKNPSISNVLKFAASAERGATVAYNQVLAGLEDANLRFLASSIEGDESQHFIVLAALVLGLAAPGPKLDNETAANVVPKAFVNKVGAQPGLEAGPADYFA